MPTVSTFYGIKIQMFHNDHGVDHFLAKYAEHKVVIAVDSNEVIVGEIPTAKMKLVEAWAVIHHRELVENANRIRQGKAPHKIKGLK